jgi:acetylglutamate kinase
MTARRGRCAISSPPRSAAADASRSATLSRSRTPVVVKFGGELLENGPHLGAVTEAVASTSGPLVIVHGGGREIDAALQAAGIEKRQVDGLRITDGATLEIVISVLAGSVNSRLVSALGSAGVRAVGLTGIDGRCGLCERAPGHRTVNGQVVDLGYVGVPSDRADDSLVRTLVGSGFVPVIACIGVDDHGQRLNVNADTLAGHLAAKLYAARLVIAGATPGVLDDEGATMSVLEAGAIAGIIASRTATAGMIAKLRACEQALASGVEEVVIVDGRDGASLAAAIDGVVPASATQVIAGLKPCATTSAVAKAARGAAL